MGHSMLAFGLWDLRKKRVMHPLEMEQITPAFDSAYPYFMNRYTQSSNGGIGMGAKCASRVITNVWNLLKLRKEDVYIVARPSAA